MRKLWMVGAAMLMPGAGMACAVLSPVDLAALPGADLVLVGEVTGYEDLPDPDGAALVTLQVEEALKGEASGQVVLVWNSGMAQGPHAARAQGRVVLGAMLPGSASEAAFADARPDLPELAQAMCGEVWMVPATDEALATVRAALE